MAYDSTVPASGHTPAQDRSAIQGNFAQIATSYNTDHVALTAGGPNEGFHSKVTLPVGSAPASISGSDVLYSKTSAGSSEIFLRRDNVATEIQMTFGTAGSGADTAKSTNNRQSFLPGGILIKTGTSIQNATSRTVIFTTDANLTAFPNNCFAVFLEPLGTGQTVAVTALSTTQFSISSASGPVTIYWMAIGN